MLKKLIETLDMFIQYPASTRKSVEITKVVIRIRKSKDRQYNDQKKKDKQRSTKHTHKTKDRVTRTPLKTTDICKMFVSRLTYCCGYLLNTTCCHQPIRYEH